MANSQAAFASDCILAHAALLRQAGKLNAGNYLIPRARFLTSGMELKIREAALADAPLISAFNLLLAEESEGLRLDEAIAQSGVTAMLKDPAKGRYYVAEVEGAVVAQVMITYEWSDWRNGNMWWIQSVYVKPEFRRAGIFRALFNHLRTLAQSRKDVCSLRLYVHNENTRAHDSYIRLGMTLTQYEVFELDVRKDGNGL
jgi:ribosomal protein S18 acetylase RimI-like enzyme